MDRLRWSPVLFLLTALVPGALPRTADAADPEPFSIHAKGIARPAALAAPRPGEILETRITLETWIPSILGGRYATQYAYVMIWPSADPNYSVDLARDLGFRREFGIALRGRLDLFRGPQIGISATRVESWVRDEVSGRDATYRLLLLDATVTVVSARGSWGRIGLEHGLAAAALDLDVDWEAPPPSVHLGGFHLDESARGFVYSVGGRLELAAGDPALLVRVEGALGVGPRSLRAEARFETEGRLAEPLVVRAGYRAAFWGFLSPDETFDIALGGWFLEAGAAF